MKRRKWSIFAMIALGLMLVLSACSNSKPSDSSDGDGKSDLLMGTGSQGGTYFGLGNEMANVWNNNIEGLNVTATESGASIENLGKIASGDFDLGMTVNLPAYNALNGEGEFEGKKVENFAFIGHIYPEVLQVVTRESTGINSIADLKGKRIAIGPPGSGTQTAAKIVLAAYGIEDGDYEQYQEGFGDAKAKLQDGTIDASFGLLGLPSSSIDELNVAVGDVKILNIEGDALSYVEENGGYSAFTIPADSYEWLQEDVQTVSAFAILVANTDTVDDDTAYQLAKVMIENADENTHPQSKHTTKENALNGLGDLLLHPGAERYYKEIGLR
ncbi:TAXI family TRAP transporter solute-binding subunit [Fervidibacillus halotolerans]|uniref:TAXI family TRAP transporter solute-binding subunit n=1 Tax=Fervidibacillus halotolerans TaxID=2980027 RepID=A0A9E8M0Y7_9BACI|nr:TAXI family TRAP transporter solute-binding subunit [Fervidibacillus halotolerans]WAA13478.1 TAXI family TRAP transporter solute-binding subunit [Fervidibacillus halotolerans]